METVREPAELLSEERNELEERLADFAAKRSLGTAGDLLSTVVVLGAPSAGHEAAEYVLADESDAAVGARILASSVLRTTADTMELSFPPSDDRTRIARSLRRLRRSLKINPRNPLAWIDSALMYTTLGQLDPAERAARIALDLAPSSPHILRASARLAIHAGDPDRAIRVLVDSDLGRDDPWIAASEVSASQIAGRPQRSIRAKRRLLEGLPPTETSELASALATLELEQGRDRKARQLFGLSLEGPNENSVAQAEWAASFVLDGFDHPSVDLIESVSDTYEAETRHLMAIGSSGAALDASESWLRFEPFSAEPALMGSYLAIVGARDFRRAISFAQRGLEANPGDHRLVNNLVVALANDDRLQEAEEWFAKIPTGTGGDAEYLATAGLLKFRSGYAAQGRELYARAVARARRSGSSRTAALASLFWAQEEALAVPGAEDVLSTLLATVESILEDGGLPEATTWYRALTHD